MSRDIFVQDLPDRIASVGEIPDEWRPSPLSFGHDDVVAAVLAAAPNAVDVGDPEWLNVELPGVSIEVDVRDEAPLTSFAFHIRASDRAEADAFVGSVLGRLGARALDPESDTGLFSAPAADE